MKDNLETENNMEIKDVDQDIDPEYRFKLVILGDSGVGKTSLVNYEINNSFINKIDSSVVFAHSFKNFSICHKIVRLNIWDTCGQKIYHSSIKNFYKSALCIIIVFSLESLDSFNNVDGWINEIKNNNYEDSIITLIGNKSDLSKTNIIKKDLIEDYCKKNDIKLYFEASAKTGENVHEIFKNLVKQLFIKYAMQNLTKNKEKETPYPFRKNIFKEKVNDLCKFCLCYNQ